MVWQIAAQAAVAAGTQLLSGLFEKKKTVPQQTTTRVNLKQLVTDAQEAGFNPLTVLRNGGAAGFATTTHPSLTQVSNPIGNALTAGVNAGMTAYNNRPDPMDTERKQLEMDLVKAELAGMSGSSSQQFMGAGSFGVPSWTGLQSEKRLPSLASAKSVTAKLKADGILPPQAMEFGKKEATNPWETLNVDGTTANTEVFEDRYGDFVGGIVGGLVTGYHDVKANIKPPVERFLKETDVINKVEKLNNNYGYQAVERKAFNWLADVTGYKGLKNATLIGNTDWSK